MEAYGVVAQWESASLAWKRSRVRLPPAPFDGRSILMDRPFGFMRRASLNMKHYVVIYESGPRNWSAYVPDLPGCVATGKTRGETERNIRHAIALHIEGMKEDGLPIPEPACEAGVVSVAA